MSRNNEKFEHIPIPTYEEAIASHPTSASPSLRGPSEISDDAERQGLLGQNGVPLSQNTPGSRPHRDGRGSYRGPVVESERSSYDSALTSPRLSEDDEDEGLRQDMEEMEMGNGDASGSGRGELWHRARLRLPKSFVTLRDTLSAIHIPTIYSIPRPAFVEALLDRIPTPPPQWKVSWPIIARLVGLFILVSVVYALVVFRVFGSNRPVVGQYYPPDSVRAFVAGAVDPKSIEKFLFEVTYDDHVAGTKGDFFLARNVYEYFLDAKLDGVVNDEYDCALESKDNLLTEL